MNCVLLPEKDFEDLLKYINSLDASWGLQPKEYENFERIFKYKDSYIRHELI